MDKKKHKILLMKKLSRDNITRVDEHTFYVPSSDPKKDPWFIYKSLNIGWTCDCPSFVFNLKDLNEKSTFECKHVKAVRSLYNI